MTENQLRAVLMRGCSGRAVLKAFAEVRECVWRWPALAEESGGCACEGRARWAVVSLNFLLDLEAPDIPDSKSCNKTHPTSPMCAATTRSHTAAQTQPQALQLN